MTSARARAAEPAAAQLARLRHAVSAHTPRKAAAHLGFRRAAVLVPLLPREDAVELLFTSRSAELKTHAGQVSFPGGSIESGETPREAALREAREEVGLDSAHVEVIGELDECPTFVAGYVITPVVGIVQPWAFTAAGRYPWNPSPAEVAALHELPLIGFEDPANLKVEYGERGGVRFEIFWYTVSGTVVWGATARIVHQLVELAARPPDS
ncbi:MAG TPA: CoA pyrophosphatase [Myxococcales bacterium]|nr:CoA pyrophosphatase [Myxococcales bacterium]